MTFLLLLMSYSSFFVKIVLKQKRKLIKAKQFRQVFSIELLALLQILV
jgi:hypothetical protein